MRALYVYLFFFSIGVSLLTSGGRLPSSDELSIYLTTEGLVERGNLSVDPALVKNVTAGRNGKFYSGVGIGQPVISVPLYLLGKVIVNVAGLADPMKTLVLRAVVSMLNQLLAGFIAVTMFAFALKLGYSRRLSLFLTLGLLFTTNLFPYLKSYMREPQLLLYLLAAAYFLYTFKLDGKRARLWYAGILCAIGLLTRLTFVISIPVLFGYLLFIMAKRYGGAVSDRVGLVRSIVAFSVPIAVALAVNALYNYLQFGGVSTMPYAGAEFSTPILVGLYGLLLSSGKSYFLFAPMAILILWSLPHFVRNNRAEAYMFIGIFIVNLLFFAKFVAWAGDGSWGPRYLISTLPFMLLPAGALMHGHVAARRWALFLATLGAVAQIGGVSIYLGNYIREIGEYPYTKAFDDPEFLYKSHYIPNYSPIAGHWKMLLRNLDVHLSGEAPQFTISDPEGRIPLSRGTEGNLLYTIDYWFMYARYAGIRPALIAGVLVPLILICLYLGYRVFTAPGIRAGSPDLPPTATS